MGIRSTRRTSTSQSPESLDPVQGPYQILDILKRIVFVCSLYVLVITTAYHIEVSPASFPDQLVCSLYKLAIAVAVACYGQKRLSFIGRSLIDIEAKAIPRVCPSNFRFGR